MLKVKSIFLFIFMMLLTNSVFAAKKICGPGGHCCFKPVKITCTFMAKPSEEVNASQLRLKNKVTFDQCEDALASNLIREEDKQFIKSTELCQAKQDSSSLSKR